MKRSGTPFRSVLALVLLGAVAAACTSLGFWQLDRAAERDALHAAIERGRGQAPIELTAASRQGELLPWRAATAEGRWAQAQSVLLENRNLEGRPGYWVATPLLLDPAGRHAILVLRGWLPREMGNAGITPAIPVERGVVRVSGELHSHVPRIFELWQWAGGRASGLPAALPLPEGAIPVVQNLQLTDLSRATGLQLVPAVLAQTAETETASAAAAPPGGAAPQEGGAITPSALAPTQPDEASPGAPSLRREWPGPSLDSDQNRGYALQWFSFAAIALVAGLFVARGLLSGRTRQPLQGRP